ncbi:MAG: hypothetical protein K8963_10735 [Proteobacteria bacterium]|nr:hypothetical protein [Pseudomonadota bacterium]
MSSKECSLQHLRVQRLTSTRDGDGVGGDLAHALSLEQIADSEELVAVIVDRLYVSLLASAQLGVYFDNVDTARLRLHQSHFMMQLFSGACTGKAHTLRAIHKRLVDKMGLDGNDFDEFCRIATDVLAKLNMRAELIAEFATRIELLREWVLDLPSANTPVKLEEFLDAVRKS